MKKLIFIPLILISLLCSATNYHFATAGDDVTGDGSIATPYKSITKLNALWAAGTFAPGDSVCFKAGDTFTGTITVAESGSVGSPIIVGKYWTGDDPIITGFTTLSSWTDEGGSIFSKTVALESSDYLIVTVDGVNTPIGRYPNTGTWNTIDSYSGNTSLTDAALDAAVLDWTGADVAIRVNQYLIQRRTITNHTSHTITYAALQFNPIVGYGYFIQNHLSTLTDANEWFYDGTDFYIYGDPAAKTVKVSAYNDGVVINSFDYITFDNLNIKGYGRYGVSITDGANIIIQNCTIEFCGENGIYGADETSGNSDYCTFDTNIITECNNNGINISSQFDNCTISSNTISKIGLVVGAAYTTSYYDQGCIGICLRPTVASSLVNEHSIIEYNHIDSVGYHGMYNYGAFGNDVTIRYNHVEYFCLLKQDGGGIYNYSEYSAVASTGAIYNNIVHHGIGNYSGTTETTYYAFGIYVDGYSQGVDVYNNTSFLNTVNFFMNGNRNGSVTNNLSYNSSASDGFEMMNFSAAITDIHANLEVKHNIWFAMDATERAYFYSGIAGDLSATAVLDSNYYVRSIDDDYTILVYRPTTGSVFKTLAEWQVLTSQDAHSLKSPISVADTADIDFYYNATSAPVTETLPYASIDIEGTKYATEYEVPAWTGVVLLKDPDPDPDPPDPPSITTSLVVQNGRLSAIGGGNVTDDGDGTVSARGICWNTTGSPTTADSKTTDGTGTGAFTSTMIGLARNTTYYIRAYATNEIGTTYGYEVTYSVIGRVGMSGGKVGFINGKRAVIY